MSVVTAHQTDLTTFCKFKREHKLRRALHLLLNPFVDGLEVRRTRKLSLDRALVIIGSLNQRVFAVYSVE